MSICPLTYEQCAEQVPLCTVQIRGTRTTRGVDGNGSMYKETTSIFAIDLNLTELLRLQNSEPLERKDQLEEAFASYESEANGYDCAVLKVKKEVLIPYEEIKLLIVQRVQELFPHFFLTSDCNLSVHFSIKDDKSEYVVGEFKELGTLMFLRTGWWGNWFCSLFCACIPLCCLCSRSCIKYRDFTPKQNVIYYKSEQVDRQFWKNYIEQHVTQESFNNEKW